MYITVIQSDLIEYLKDTCVHFTSTTAYYSLIVVVGSSTRAIGPLTRREGPSVPSKLIAMVERRFHRCRAGMSDRLVAGCPACP